MLKKKFRTLQELEDNIPKEEITNKKTAKTVFIDYNLNYFNVYEVYLKDKKL